MIGLPIALTAAALMSIPIGGRHEFPVLRGEPPAVARSRISMRVLLARRKHGLPGRWRCGYDADAQCIVATRRA